MGPRSVSCFRFRFKAKSGTIDCVLIGYARVSTAGQNLDRQIAQLRKAGCEKIYREKASGETVKGRPQLEKAIDCLGIDDVLVIAEWDRATTSMMDGIDIMKRVAERDGAIKVLDKPHLDLTTAIGRGFLAFLSSMAEDQRERIVKRAADGRAEAKKKGVKFGPKPKLTDHQRELVLRRLRNGESCQEIADDLGVGKSTVWRVQA